MEQHPVPQNVTTFQFRLIGDMTIKQFGYLAGGAILAYISYKLPLPFFFTWPMTLIFALGGVGFAFVPVEERPMDIWVLSFIKSVYSPTQYVWVRQPKTETTPQGTTTAAKPSMPANPLTNLFTGLPHAASKPAAPAPAKPPAGPPTRTAAVLQNVYADQKTVRPAAPVAQQPVHAPPALQTAPHVVSANPSHSPWAWLFNLFSVHPQPAKPTTVTVPVGNFPMPSITGRRLDLSPPPVVRPPDKMKQEELTQVQQKEAALEQKLVSLKKDLENKTMTEARILELQKQLTEVLAQKDLMEQELVKLRRQTAAPPPAAVPVPQQPTAPPTAQTKVAMPPAPKQPSVKIITPESAVKAGLPRLTTFPNVVTGITKDSDNNFLPGVLVTVKDREGIPVRALKTNRLGQFAASTPLSNGVYFVEIEDPRNRYVFDRVQITLNGSIVPAIEIIAKSQKQVNRERLAREVFGTNS